MSTKNWTRRWQLCFLFLFHFHRGKWLKWTSNCHETWGCKQVGRDRFQLSNFWRLGFLEARKSEELSSTPSTKSICCCIVFVLQVCKKSLIRMHVAWHKFSDLMHKSCFDCEIQKAIIMSFWTLWVSSNLEIF